MYSLFYSPGGIFIELKTKKVLWNDHPFQIKNLFLITPFWKIKRSMHFSFFKVNFWLQKVHCRESGHFGQVALSNTKKEIDRGHFQDMRVKQVSYFEWPYFRFLYFSLGQNVIHLQFFIIFFRGKNFCPTYSWPCCCILMNNWLCFFICCKFFSISFCFVEIYMQQKKN